MFFLYMWKYAGIPISELFFCFETYSAGFHGYTTEQLTEFNTTGQCVYLYVPPLLSSPPHTNISPIPSPN